MRVVLGIAPPAAPTAPKDLATTAAERARYLGNYALAMPDGSRQRARVFEQTDSLMVQLAAAPAMRLRSQGAHVFVAMDGTRVTFDVISDRATGFMWGTGSRRLEALRTP
jgi:hypothetical protein